MKFAISKCAMVEMKNGKMVRSEGIEISNGKMIKWLWEGEGYEYIDVLHSDKVKSEEAKEIPWKKYFK